MIKNIDIVLIVFFLLFFFKNAYAYIDPGSITVLLQVIVALIAGSVIAFRRIFVNLFCKIFRIGKNDNSEEK